MTKLTAIILKVTGYRFGKDGMFGRGSKGRELLRKIGVSCVAANNKADAR